MVDMAHFAGLVAAGLHPNPVPIADVVTTTVHKTLGGARGGAILCKEEYAKKINSAVFPGQQGGPLEHVIAGKAVAFKIAATETFRERQQRTVDGAKAVAEELLDAGHGVSVLTGGTDVHLVLVDLRESELDGQQAEDRLHEIGITVNRNAVPFDPRPPMVSAACASAPPRSPPAACRRRLHRRRRVIARALQPGFDEVREELAERVAGDRGALPAVREPGGRRGGQRWSSGFFRPKPIMEAPVTVSIWTRRQANARASSDGRGQHKCHAHASEIWIAASSSVAASAGVCSGTNCGSGAT